MAVVKTPTRLIDNQKVNWEVFPGELLKEFVKDFPGKTLQNFPGNTSQGIPRTIPKGVVEFLPG